jgi:LmbE family N-acetylglucosaminyl deacetylase
MTQTLLVVASHPDDEVLGCGATIAKHIAAGDEVHVAILAEGAMSRQPGATRDSMQEELSTLARVAHAAHKVLSTTSLELLDYPDNCMDTVALLDVVRTVENLITRFQPRIVYTHHAGDVNIDHRVTHDAVITACRPLGNHPVKTLLYFEVASSTEWQTPDAAMPFQPNWWVDVSDTFPLKRQALEAYAAEMRAWPHPRSLEGLEYLARWRGATVGVDFAEAFVLGRHHA